MQHRGKKSGNQPALQKFGEEILSYSDMDAVTKGENLHMHGHAGPATEKSDQQKCACAVRQRGGKAHAAGKLQKPRNQRADCSVRRVGVRESGKDLPRMPERTEKKAT